MKYTTFNSVEIVGSFNSVFHQNVHVKLFIVEYYFYAFLRFKIYMIYNLEAFTFCTSKYTMNVFVMSTIYHSNIQ